MALTEPAEQERLDVTESEPPEWVPAGAPSAPGF
jgi:hypothetical protein